MDRCLPLICSDATSTSLDADALTETAVRIRPLGLRFCWYDLALTGIALVAAGTSLLPHLVR